MNFVATFIAWIFDPQPQDALRREEAYLAQSVDMCDLERRMRELERRRVADAGLRNA